MLMASHHLDDWWPVELGKGKKMVVSGSVYNKCCVDLHVIAHGHMWKHSHTWLHVSYYTEFWHNEPLLNPLSPQSSCHLREKMEAWGQMWCSEKNKQERRVVSVLSKWEKMFSLAERQSTKALSSSPHPFFIPQDELSLSSEYSLTLGS